MELLVANLPRNALAFTNKIYLSPQNRPRFPAGALLGVQGIPFVCDAHPDGLNGLHRRYLQVPLDAAVTVKVRHDEIHYEPTAEPTDQRSSVRKLISIMGRMLGLTRFSSMTSLNTETVSMAAVASVVSNDTSSLWKYIHSFGALLLVCLQFYALRLVVTESSSPKCNSMTDCPSGTFCANNDDFSLPSCYDCAHVKPLTNMNQTKAEEVCPAALGIDKWEHREYLAFDHEELWMKSTTETTTLQQCISFLHCKETELDKNKDFKGQCDFIALNKSKMNGGTFVMIFFLGLLWALPISQDVEEAATEERVMDHHLAGSLNIPAEIVRLSLRIRRCLLPFFATIATFVLLITSNISAKNIILNFMAITFVTEADNVLAVLFFGTHQRELMEKVAKEAYDSEEFSEPKFAFLLARVQGLSCVAILLIVLTHIDTWVTDCSELYWDLNEVAAYSLGILLVGQSFYRGCVKMHKETTRVRILSALAEFFRNYLAAYLGWLSTAILSFFVNGGSLPILFSTKIKLSDLTNDIRQDKGLAILTVFYFWLMVIHLSILIIIETYKRKCCTRSQE